MSVKEVSVFGEQFADFGAKFEGTLAALGFHRLLRRNLSALDLSNNLDKVADLIRYLIYFYRGRIKESSIRLKNMQAVSVIEAY